MNDQSHTGAAHSTSDLILARRGKRILSTVFDAVITALAVMLVTLASGQFEEAAPYLNNTIEIRVAAIIVLTYCSLHGYPLLRSSQTLGKKLFRLQIVTAERDSNKAATESVQRAGPIQLAVRASTLLLLVFIPIVGLWLQALHLLDAVLLFTKPRRALHDYIARTTVIDLTHRS